MASYFANFGTSSYNTLGLTCSDMFLRRTLAISIVSGLSGGFLCSLDFWNPVHALFRDDDHFVHVLEKYPKAYLENVDESVQYGKVALSNIQALMIANIPSNLTSSNDRKAWVGKHVYDKFVQHGG